MLMSVNPPSLLGGFLIVALFLIVFCAVYITRVITVILTAKLKPSNQIKAENSGKVFSVRERRTPATARKRISPALKSTVKKPVGKVYYIETDD